MRDDFAVFITSYNNPNNITTIDSLLNAGYTGDWYVIIEDNDPQLEAYKEKIPEDKLLLYNKKEQIKYYDTCDNFNILNTHTNSINLPSYFAKKMGYKYYYNAEDDYKGYFLKYKQKDKAFLKPLKNINMAFDMLIDLLNLNDKIICLSFDRIMKHNSIGIHDYWNDNIFKYFNYNGWICDVDKEFKFRGTVSEDVIVILDYYKKGYITFTILPIKNEHIWYYDKKKSEITGSGNDLVNMSVLDRENYYFYIFMTNPAGTKLVYENRLDIKYIKSKLVPKIIDERWKKFTYLDSKNIFNNLFIDDLESKNEINKFIDFVYLHKIIPIENFYEQTVNIDNIIIVQDYLYKESLDSLINNSEYIPHIGSKYTDIYGFKISNTNKIVLADGHHRLAQKILNNEKTVKMKVYNLTSEHFKNLQKILGER